MNPALHAGAYLLPGLGMSGLALLLWGAGRAGAREPDAPRWARWFARTSVAVSLIVGLGLLATGIAFARVALAG